MSALDCAADEQQARCELAFLHNLEGRHEVINTLELIERSRVNNQGTADRRCLIVMGVNQFNMVLPHDLEKLMHQQEIKDQPPVTRPNTDAAIPAYVANTINRDPPYWNAVMKRVGNDANRMSTAGERLR